MCKQPARFFMGSRIFHICFRLLASPLPGIGCFSLRGQRLWQRRGQTWTRFLHAQRAYIQLY